MLMKFNMFLYTLYAKVVFMPVAFARRQRPCGVAWDAIPEQLSVWLQATAPPVIVHTKRKKYTWYIPYMQFADNAAMLLLTLSRRLSHD